MLNRLFSVPPQDIVEHPTDLPIPVNDIPNGEIKGWDCFAPPEPCCQDKPFVAIVTRPYDNRVPCITIKYSQYKETSFWYGIDNQGTGRPDRPCWYQSGETLRFIKARKTRKS